VCAPACNHTHSRVLILYVDIDPEARSKATCACLQGQPAVSEAQGSQPTTRCLTQPCSSMDSATADQMRRDIIVEHPNMQAPSPRTSLKVEDHGNIENRRSRMVEKRWNMAMPPRAGFPNVDTNARGQGTVHVGGDATSGSGRASNRLAATIPDAVNTSTSSRSPGPANLAQHEGDARVSVPDIDPVGSDPTDMEAGPLLDTIKTIDGRDTVKDGGGDGDTLSGFLPHILHEPHEPVPIAIVNRSPTGSEHFPFLLTAYTLTPYLSCLFWRVGPGHYHVRRNPQDVAWLSAVRYAQKNIFMSVPSSFVSW
jgi:hypothetical protein